MLRIGLAGATLYLTCSAAFAYQMAVASSRYHSGFEIADSVPTEVKPPPPAPVAERARSSSREVIWRPELNGGNPFGYIPTEWTVRPQLLPRTWEVTTMFASDGR